MQKLQKIQIVIRIGEAELRTYIKTYISVRVLDRNFKLWVLDFNFCTGITMKIDGFFSKNFRKNMGASTHIFKNHGCYSTHSTHTNEGPECFITSLVHGLDRMYP